MRYYHSDDGPLFNNTVFNRTELIKYIYKKYNYSSYLEIGYGRGENWSQLQFIQNKVCIDPNVNTHFVLKQTSDTFFEDNKQKFDLIFIDGDHSAEQVYKDVLNSLKCLNDGGTILTHDNNPPEFAHEDLSACGSSWRTIPVLRTRDDLNICTFIGDLGVGIIKKEKNKNLLKLNKSDDLYDTINQNLTHPNFSLFKYEFLQERRHELLNLLTLEQTLEWLDGGQK